MEWDNVYKFRMVDDPEDKDRAKLKMDWSWEN